MTEKEYKEKLTLVKKCILFMVVSIILFLVIYTNV
jgi:competence protein ComGC